MQKAVAMHGSRRISDIECLRGIAVVFVVLFHARNTLFSWKIPLWDHIFDNYFSLWPGVDLFFAISGFVIARTLLPTLRQCEGSLEFVRAALVFWVRRVWRLLPSAWLWLLIMLAGSAVFNRSGVFDTFHANFESTIAGMLSIANVRFAAGFRVFGYGVSTHYWSLSLEEQFYLVLPLMIFLSGRRLTVVLLATTFLVFLLPQTTLLMSFRVHAILLGVLLAIFSEQPAYVLFEPVALKDRPGLGLAMLALLLGFISSLAVFGQNIASYNVDIIAVLSATLVLIASYDRDYLFPYPVLQRVIGWIGSRSYALYLVHVFAFVVTREFWFRVASPGTNFSSTYTLRFTVTGLFLLVTFAELNYRLVERPLRKYGKDVAARLAGRPLFIPTMAKEDQAVPVATSAGDSLIEGEVPAGP